ncbi:hypothetical protein [Protofrankia sp. BMG5.30]|uniref:hypothetical protein n=1 Tax=Protofrankia sp. BMG5.30 TaxID=1834514 RepID=UPI00352A2FF7
MVLSILTRGRDDLPLDVSAMALLGMINWMYRWYRPTFHSGPEEIARTFAELFLNGYTPPSGA